MLRFLVQWLALSSDYYDQRSQPYKSHYGLLNDFQQLPEEEIESFLPQICNILFDCQSSGSEGDNLFQTFERLLVDKCADCLPFGMRVCGLLKV